MGPKWKRLAADLLGDASHHFGRRVCNDLDTPEGWTGDEVREFYRAYEDWNSQGLDYDPAHDRMPPDFAAMAFPAHLLYEESDPRWNLPSWPSCWRSRRRRRTRRWRSPRSRR